MLLPFPALAKAKPKHTSSPSIEKTIAAAEADPQSGPLIKATYGAFPVETRALFVENHKVWIAGGGYLQARATVARGIQKVLRANALLIYHVPDANLIAFGNAKSDYIAALKHLDVKLCTRDGFTRLGAERDNDPATIAAGDRMIIALMNGLAIAKRSPVNRDPATAEDSALWLQTLPQAGASQEMISALISGSPDTPMDMQCDFDIIGYKALGMMPGGGGARLIAKAAVADFNRSGG
jgi:hypothetical protein